MSISHALHVQRTIHVHMYVLRKYMRFGFKL